MPKRKEAEEDCPICFQRVRDGTRSYPFDCGHVLCTTCDTNMRERRMHTCPVCRAPRDGYFLPTSSVQHPLAHPAVLPHDIFREWFVSGDSPRRRRTDLEEATERALARLEAEGGVPRIFPSREVALNALAMIHQTINIPALDRSDDR